MKNNKIAMISLIVILLFVLFAFIGPNLSPYSYEQQIRGHENLTPCLAHPFGTDKLGRDLLVRTMVGARISLIIGLGSAIIVLIVACYKVKDIIITDGGNNGAKWLNKEYDKLISQVKTSTDKKDMKKCMKLNIY